MFEPTLIVLLYHNCFESVPPEPWRSLYGSYMTSIGEFKQHMDLLARMRDRHLLEFATPEEFYSIGDEPQETLYLHITFDDGYRSALPALDILHGEGMPATLFVNSGLLERSQLAWPEQLARLFQHTAGRELHVEAGERNWHIDPSDCEEDRIRAFVDMRNHLKRVSTNDRESILERLFSRHGFDPHNTGDIHLLNGIDLLNWDEVVQIHSNGFKIGGHTLTHPILSRCEPRRTFDEIVQDKENLEKKLASSISEFAIPNGHCGDYDKTVLSICREVGYDTIYTATAGVNKLGRRGDPLYRYNVGCFEYDLKTALERVVDQARFEKNAGDN